MIDNTPSSQTITTSNLKNNDSLDETSQKLINNDEHYVKIIIKKGKLEKRRNSLVNCLEQTEIDNNNSNIKEIQIVDKDLEKQSKISKNIEEKKYV